jgi:hypothetical protein
MALDTTELSKLALELIERLADDYEDWEKVKTGVVGLVVEVNGKHPEMDNEVTVIEYRCSDPRRWVQGAIFDRAKHAALWDD